MEEEKPDMTADMSDDDIAASLGFATSMGEQHHMASQEAMNMGGDTENPQEDAAESSEEPQDNSEASKEPGDDLGSVKDEILGEIKGLREAIEAPDKSPKEKIEEMRADLDKLEVELGGKPAE